MLGQAGLKERAVNLIKEGNFPKFIILQAPFLQGKKEFCKYVSGLLNADIHWLSNLKVDAVREIKADSGTLCRERLYVLCEFENATMQAINALLKFLEEPNKNVYVIATVINYNKLPETIKTRGQLWNLSRYNMPEIQEQLTEITGKPELINMCSSPGQVYKLDEIGFMDAFNLIDKIVNHIENINIGNVFNIWGKNVEPLFGIENIKLFFDLLRAGYFKKVQADKKYINCLRVLNSFEKDVENNSLNINNVMDMMFLNLRRVNFVDKQSI